MIFIGNHPHNQMGSSSGWSCLWKTVATTIAMDMALPDLPSHWHAPTDVLFSIAAILIGWYMMLPTAHTQHSGGAIAGYAPGGGRWRDVSFAGMIGGNGKALVLVTHDGVDQGEVEAVLRQRWPDVVVKELEQETPTVAMVAGDAADLGRCGRDVGRQITQLGD